MVFTFVSDFFRNTLEKIFFFDFDGLLGRKVGIFSLEYWLGFETITHQRGLLLDLLLPQRDLLGDKGLDCRVKISQGLIRFYPCVEIRFDLFLLLNKIFAWFRVCIDHNQYLFELLYCLFIAILPFNGRQLPGTHAFDLG